MLRTWLIVLCFLATSANGQVIQTWSFDSEADIPTEEDWTWMEDGDAIVIDSTEFAEGSASMRIDCAEGYCGWWWEIEVTDALRGEAVTLSVDMKSDYSDDDNPAYLWLRTDDEYGERLTGGGIWDNAPMGKQDWDRYSYTLPVPEEAHIIGIMLESGGLGSAWFDNMALEAQDWGWTDSVGKWFSDQFSFWTSSWFGWLRILMVYAFLPGVLLLFAARSKNKECIQSVPWIHRYFGMACLIMACVLGTTIYRLTSLPLHYVFFAGGRPNQILYTLLFAAFFTAVWYRYRDRIDEVQFWRNQTLVIRYFLAGTLLIYAVAKVYRSQFMGLTPEVLDSRFGDRTSMRLLWQFFGHSYPYVLFAAAGQFVGSFMLLSRKTYQIGAVILIMVVSNIVFVNYAYDIRVKYPSTLLLIMLLFLVAEEVPRWIDTLLYRATELKPTVPYRPGLPAKARIPLAIAFGCYFLWFAHSRIYPNIQRAVDGAIWVPESGVWTFDDRGIEFPSDSTGATVTWNRLIMDEFVGFRGNGGITAKMDDEIVSQGAQNKFDSLGAFVLQFRDSTDQYTGFYSIDADTLRLSGVQFGDSLSLELVKRTFQLDPDPLFPMLRLEKSPPEEPESED